MNLLADIQQAYETIRSGGTILYPTDTVWGIGCDATDEKAIQKIHQIKQRPAHKNYIILVPNMQQLLRLIAAPPLMIDDIIASFSGATTFIIDGAINLPDALINENGSIAIRIPKDDFCIQLLKKVGKPIVSTSANISGETAAAIFSDINPVIIEAVDYNVQHRRNDTQIAKPSRIVKILPDGNTEIIRE